MKAPFFLLIIIPLISINILQTKKYLIEVADDEMANNSVDPGTVESKKEAYLKSRKMNIFNIKTINESTFRKFP